MMSILEDAQALLGPPLKIENHRQWATWWCPFHPDAARAGRGGQANFGVHTERGYWKCLRCGAKGPSIAALKKRLGITMTLPRPVLNSPRQVDRPRIARLDEALAAARGGLLRSPAWEYLLRRGIQPHTALLFGLGYGLPHPCVSPSVLVAARSARLIGRQGRWLWEGALVYADPPAAPVVLQVRHLRRTAQKKYQTWGRLLVPLGAWRIQANTLVVIVVEGLFDALAIAQGLHDRQLTHAVVVYTAGATPSHAMLDWFAQAAPEYGFILVPDPDAAGLQWTRTLRGVLRAAGGAVHTVSTPDGLDPDEAVHLGWWPSGI